MIQPPFIFEQENVSTDTIVFGNKQKSEYYFGACMAFASSITGAFHYVIVGRLFKNSTSNSSVLLAFYGGFGGLLILLPAAYLDKDQRILSLSIGDISSSTWIQLSTVAVLGLVGFVTVNASIKKIKPLYVSFVGVSEIVFAYLAQIVVFGVVPNLFGIIGSIIVVLTVCVLPLETWISEKLSVYLKTLF